MSEQPDTHTPPSPRPDPRIGELISGRYKVIAPLGSGGVAKVYRALQLPLNRQVALKVVRPDLEEEQREQFEARFLREAAQAGRLSHPNVVTVYDFGRAEDGSCYIAMELLEGYTLRRLLKGEPLDPERSVRLVLGVARGLRHAHKRGMVHRDVKPSNIFIVIDDEGRELPRLLDFGLVKGDDSATITRSGAFMGTPHYIAPEQARGLNSVDARADIYSLGCILYRMLTGVLPYMADNPMIIALRHVRDPYPPMAQRRPDVSVDPALERIVRTCMEKDPKQRYATAGALARDLEAWLGESTLPAGDENTDVSITEGPPSTLSTAPPRRRWLVPFVVFASLSAGAGLGAWMLTQEREVEPTTMVGEPVVAEAPEDEAGDGALVDAARSEVEPAEAAEATEAAKLEAAKTETPKTEAPKSETPKSETPKSETPKAETPKTDAPKAETPKVEAPKKEAPKPASGGAVVVDGVSFDAAHAARALAFINSASKEDLLKAGVYSRGVNIVLERRPFNSLEAFGETSYIGEKSVEAVKSWTR